MTHYHDWMMFDSREQLEKGLMGQDVKTLVSIILELDDMLKVHEQWANKCDDLSVVHLAGLKGKYVRRVKTCGDFEFTHKAAMSILGDKHGS